MREERLMECKDYLMPLARHEEVIVKDGGITINGHSYKSKPLCNYDHQKVTVNEFEDMYCVFSDEKKLICKLTKDV